MSHKPLSQAPADPGDIGRAPAPEELELVRALINSRNVEGEAKIESPSSQWDKLATAASAEAWLREQRLIGAKARVSSGDAAQLRSLREALRGLAARNNGLELPTDLELLRRAGDRAKFALQFDPQTGRSRLVPTAPGMAGIAGRILGEVHEAMHDGTWQRLKICGAEACLWAYYDRSKNSHSKWCSAAVCGNRDKVRRYRARTKKGR